MVLRMIVGLVLTVAAFAIFGRRVWWLKRLAFSGQPAPERVAAVRTHPGRDVETQLTEVVGQRKLLQWSVPGSPRGDLLGVHRPAAYDHRGYGARSPARSRSGDRALGGDRVP